VQLFGNAKQFEEAMHEDQDRVYIVVD